jgi:hypothetical protein
MELIVIVPPDADQDLVEQSFQNLTDAESLDGIMIEQLRESPADARHLSGGDLITGIKLVGEHLWEPATIAAICSLLNTHMKEQTKRKIIKWKLKNKKGQQAEFSGYVDKPEHLAIEVKKWLDKT